MWETLAIYPLALMSIGRFALQCQAGAKGGEDDPSSASWMTSFAVRSPPNAYQEQGKASGAIAFGGSAYEICTDAAGRPCILLVRERRLVDGARTR